MRFNLELKRLLLWADPHIGDEGNDDRLEQLVEYQLSHGREGDAVLVLGDVTDNGRPSEYARAREILERLCDHYPVLVLPGNHDCGALGIVYDDKARRYFWEVLDMHLRARMAKHGAYVLKAPQYPVRVSFGQLAGGYDVLLLDSCEGQGGEVLPPLARGELGANQLKRLSFELERCSRLRRRAIIALHHHPYWSDWAHELEDAEQLLALLRRYAGTVGAVVFGHRHRLQSLYDQPGQYMALGSARCTQPHKGELSFAVLELGINEIKLTMRRIEDAREK